MEGYTDPDSAIDDFKKKFKSKTSHAWEGNQATYAGGKKNKYSVIYESYGSSSQSSKLTEAGIGGDHDEEPVVYAEPEVTGVLAKFVEFITDSNMWKGQLSALGVDTSKMPLGDISERTVEAGFQALLAVEAHLKGQTTGDLGHLCSQFYTYIPHAFGRQRPPTLTLDDIQNKKDMLNVLSDVGAAVRSAAKSKSKRKKGAATQQAIIDVQYNSIGCSLEPVAPDSDAFEMIVNYTKNTQGARKCEVIEAFEVQREDDFSSFDAMENRKLLWHGTNVAVVAAILKSGLRIMPMSGGRVGSGIYLASENGKSAGYVTAQGHTGVMFLCEAVLGRQRIVNKDGQIGWTEKDPCKKAFDSVLAIGRTEPDPKDDTEVIMDGNPVIVPQGKVIANPDLKGPSDFAQSEYLVYNETQCRIRYVLKMNFEKPGGNWH